MIVDQNNDITFSRLRNVVHTYPNIKPYIKKAAVGEEYRSSLPRDSFADKSNKRFPLASAADAILSKAYATKVANLASHIMQEIDTALALYSVPTDVFEITKQASTVEEQPVYLIESQSKLPIYSHTSTKIAEQRLLANKRLLKPSTMSEAATKLIKHARSRGDNVSEEVLKYAGLVQSNPDFLTTWLEARSTKSKQENTKVAYAKLAEVTKNIGSSVTREELIKLANTISQLDRDAGMERYYNKKLPDPISTVFNTKVAMQPMLSLGSKDVPLEKLLSISPAMYGDLLGSDIVEEISKDGELIPENLVDIFETLPRDMKKLLVDKLGL